jgi:hypothetical protein
MPAVSFGEAAYANSWRKCGRDKHRMPRGPRNFARAILSFKARRNHFDDFVQGVSYKHLAADDKQAAQREISSFESEFHQRSGSTRI